MPLYSVRAAYTPESTKALRAAGAATRVEAMSQMVASVGGKVVFELCWVAHNLSPLMIVELPSDAAAASVLSTAQASGAAVWIEVDRLLTASQLDEAFGVNVQLRAPGE